MSRSPINRTKLYTTFRHENVLRGQTLRVVRHQVGMSLGRAEDVLSATHPLYPRLSGTVELWELALVHIPEDAFTIMAKLYHVELAVFHQVFTSLEQQGEAQ